jgi:hypothetical protein
MKHVILEWSLIFACGMTLALTALWGISRFYDRMTYHLRFPTSRSVTDDLHILVADGDLALCDQFDVDAAGNVRPLIVDWLRPADIRKGNRLGRLTIPGLDFRYCRFASDGYLIWSLRLSLLIPAVLMLLLAILFRRRLKQLRRRSMSARS